MAIHAILRKIYVHYENNRSYGIGQRCHIMKRYTFEGLYRTVKWPLTPFYIKHMAIIGIAYKPLLVRDVQL